MHEAFWNGLLDVRWEDAPLGPETTRLVLRLRECGYAERTCRDYGHAVIHLGRVLREETGGVEGVRDDAVIQDFLGRHLLEVSHDQPAPLRLCSAGSSRTTSRRNATSAPTPSSPTGDAIKLLLGFAARRQRQVIRLQLADLGPATVLAFLDYLETERHNCAATRDLQADRDPPLLRLRRRPRPPTPRPVPSYPRHPGQEDLMRLPLTYLNRDEVEALLAAPSPADRPACVTGRCSPCSATPAPGPPEAVGLDINHVRLQTPSQVRIFGKGRKEALPLWQETADAVRAYPGQRDDSDRRTPCPSTSTASGSPASAWRRSCSVTLRWPPAARHLSPPSLSARTHCGIMWTAGLCGRQQHLRW